MVPGPNPTQVTPLRWQGNRLLLLDQRRLPSEELWVSCATPDEVADAIRTMVVR
ncbi:MAG: S-methyl-5-thioribose-1-phosphate isomerase, partial [Thermoanaerobaculia bacterium]